MLFLYYETNDEKTKSHALTCSNSKSLQLFVRELCPIHPRKQRQDGNACVSSDHCNINIFRIPSLTICDKGISTADIKSGDTSELFGVINACFFQNFGGDRDG